MPSTLILADFDLPTRSMSGCLLRWIVPRIGLEPATLYGVLARRLPFQVSAPQSDIIIGTGHGDPDTFSAQNEAVILDAGKYNPKEVEGKVIKLLSCQTAKALGPDIITNGAICYMGYQDDLVWIMDADKASTPWSDEMAAKALMPVIDGINALLDGRTTGEAFEIELQGYSRNAEVEEDELIKACLEFNHDHAVLLGDETARVRARPRIVFPLAPPPLPPAIAFPFLGLLSLLPVIPPPP